MFLPHATCYKARGVFFVLLMGMAMADMMLGNGPCLFLEPAERDSCSRMTKAGVTEPALMDGSVVVKTGMEVGPVFARMKVMMLFLFIGGLVLLVAGLVRAFTLDKAGNSPMYSNHPLTDAQLVLSMVGTVVGVGMLVFMPFALKSRVNRALKNKQEIWADVLPQAVHFNVNMEDAATFNQFKVLADDYGVAWFDELGGRMIIEGLRYRYFFVKEDFHHAKAVKAGGSQGVQLTIQLSEKCTLAITVICEQVRQELKKQVGLPGKSVLVSMIEQTLEVDVEA